MALDDPYATVQEYKARIGEKGDSLDGIVGPLLPAASRLVERDLGRVFNQTAAGTVRYFRGNGLPKLWLPPGSDLVSVATDGIGVDEDLDGTYSTQFDPAGESWVVLGPYDAAERNEAYEFVELLPLTSNDTIEVFPKGRRNLRITGVFGWPSVPELIREFVIHLVHDMYDAHQTGALLRLQSGGVDQSLPLRDQAWRLWERIEGVYRIARAS